MKVIVISVLYILMAFSTLSSLFSQAKKPTLMIVPSDRYCIAKGYQQTFEDQGRKVVTPDYKRAFQSDADLRLIVSAINTYMANEGFPLKDLEQVIKSLESEDIEVQLVEGKDKSPIMETPIDKFKRRAKADIILDLDFSVKQNGPKNYVTFMLKGLDAYTNKQIAGVESIGEGSMSVPIDKLLLENNYTQMSDFHTRLRTHFDNLFKEGREVMLKFKITESADIDLEKEYTYNGEELELGEIIEEWLRVECVNKRFTVLDATETQLSIEQARIPMYDAKDNPIDARDFMQKFRKKLKESPYGLSARVYQRGLGEAWIIIGAKSND